MVLLGHVVSSFHRVVDRKDIMAAIRKKHSEESKASVRHWPNEQSITIVEVAISDDSSVVNVTR